MRISTGIINDIKQLTQTKQHTDALILLATALEAHKAIALLQALNLIQDDIGDLCHDLEVFRDSIHTRLRVNYAHNVENWIDVENAF